MRDIVGRLDARAGRDSAEVRVGWSEIAFADGRVWHASPASRDGGVQRRLFHSLAGDWMGQDRRRGFPYTWIPGHLADARDRISPRSFLAALRAAAEDTEQRHPRCPTVLHDESIKRGVQRASQIRVDEL